MLRKKKASNELKYFCSSKKYYAIKMTFLDVFRSVKFIQFQGDSSYLKYMRTLPYHTKQIDLKPSSDAVKASFSKRVRAKINKATREEVRCSLYDLNSAESLEFYVDYCNRHIISKNLLYRLSKKDVDSFPKHYKVTQATYNGEILVMHGYFIDSKSKRVYIHESVSQFRTIDASSSQVDRDFISRANCLLHYEDMCYFKKQGIELYDFGGYGVDTEDQSILNINRFKDGFRGKLVQENHYESYMFFMINSFYHQIKPCVMRMRMKKIWRFVHSFK